MNFCLFVCFNSSKLNQKSAFKEGKSAVYQAALSPCRRSAAVGCQMKKLCYCCHLIVSPSPRWQYCIIQKAGWPAGEPQFLWLYLWCAFAVTAVSNRSCRSEKNVCVCEHGRCVRFCIPECVCVPIAPTSANAACMSAKFGAHRNKNMALKCEEEK